VLSRCLLQDTLRINVSKVAYTIVKGRKSLKALLASSRADIKVEGASAERPRRSPRTRAKGPSERSVDLQDEDAGALPDQAVPMEKEGRKGRKERNITGETFACFTGEKNGGLSDCQAFDDLLHCIRIFTESC
jgi:hypothetical protein